MPSRRDTDRRQSASTISAPERLGVLVKGLIEAGVIDPPLELERRYLDRKLSAQIEADGSVTCMGRAFCTLSSAASYARSTCTRSSSAGAHELPSNGWTFWQYRGENGQLRSLRDLRSEYLART